MDGGPQETAARALDPLQREEGTGRALPGVSPPNWTEIDVWRYIHREGIPIPGLYLAHEREVVRRDGVLLARTGLAQLTESDEVGVRRVRFRTVGDVTCTGAIGSEADSVQSVIREIETARSTERAARSDDRRSETAMEDRKREGYF